MNFHQHAKNQFIPSIHFWDKINFRVLWTNWSHPFLTLPTQKIFDLILIYVNLYQHAKKSGYFIDLFRTYSSLKNPAIWLRTFWLSSQEPKFSQIWDFCRNTAKNINFHYRTNFVKINPKFFNKFKKPCLWPIFGSFSRFWGQKALFWKIQLCHAQLLGFWHHTKT